MPPVAEVSRPASIELPPPPDGRALRVAVVGSRDYPDLLAVDGLVSMLPAGCVVVSGHARGVDVRAEAAATARGLEVHCIPPDYKTYGRGAPLVRNQHIAEFCDVMIAFWHGTSRGTRHALQCARRLDRPTMVIKSDCDWTHLLGERFFA